MEAYGAMPGEELTFDQMDFNSHMVTIQMSVQNGFGICQDLWAYNSFQRKLQLGSFPIAAFY